MPLASESIGTRRIRCDRQTRLWIDSRRGAGIMRHGGASLSMKAYLCEPGVSGADRTPDQRLGAAPSRGVRHYPRRRICRKSNLFTRPPPVPHKSPRRGNRRVRRDGGWRGTWHSVPKSCRGSIHGLRRPARRPGRHAGAEASRQVATPSSPSSASRRRAIPANGCRGWSNQDRNCAISSSRLSSAGASGTGAGEGEARTTG